VPPRPEAFYFHNWHSDHFFRGAYSYASVNALSARKTLSKPTDGTLFFAGEAAETNGHDSTVHGAIVSGLKAAR
jgi:monoamine oxidase